MSTREPFANTLESVHMLYAMLWKSVEEKKKGKLAKTLNFDNSKTPAVRSLAGKGGRYQTLKVKYCTVLYSQVTNRQSRVCELRT